MADREIRTGADMVDTLAFILAKHDGDRTHHRLELPDYGRYDLASWFGQLGFKVGAEVGVQKGKFARVICMKNPGVKLYAIDPWRPYADIPCDQEEMDAFETQTRERLEPYKTVIMKMTSLEAADMIEDGSLDFVYLDGQHDFINVTQDLHAWSPKVRSGGIIAGHDFLKPRRPTGNLHVAYVVNAWTEAFFIDPWFRLGNSHTSDRVRDGYRSYFWVKP